MSNSEQAQYILSLPLSQWKAIKKAITVVARGGMCREDALRLMLEQHQQSQHNRRMLRG